MPKIILQNYILHCSLLLSFSNCFQHCSLVSTKLWLVKFSQAHLICKYLPLCSSFIIVTNNFNCKVWYHHKAHKGKWECQKEYIITKTNQNGTIFLTTQIIYIYIFFISWTPYAVEVKWEGSQKRDNNNFTFITK